MTISFQKEYPSEVHPSEVYLSEIHSPKVIAAIVTFIVILIMVELTEVMISPTAKKATKAGKIAAVPLGIWFMYYVYIEIRRILGEGS